MNKITKKLILFFAFILGYIPSNIAFDPITASIAIGTKAIIIETSKIIALGCVGAISTTTISRMIPTPQEKLAQEKAKYDLAISQQNEYLKRLEVLKKRVADWDELFPQCKENTNNPECQEYEKFRKTLIVHQIELVKNGASIGRTEQEPSNT